MLPQFALKARVQCTFLLLEPHLDWTGYGVLRKWPAGRLEVHIYMLSSVKSLPNGLK